MPTSHTATRAARNEAIFRELNEHLEATSTGTPSDVNGFVCECADISCTTVLAVELGDYAFVRRHLDRFIVAPADTHVDVTVEKVIEQRTGYWIVEKIGVAGDVAEDLDPRT